MRGLSVVTCSCPSNIITITLFSRAYWQCGCILRLHLGRKRRRGMGVVVVVVVIVDSIGVSSGRTLWLISNGQR
jgi:hypothetical protein